MQHKFGHLTCAAQADYAAYKANNLDETPKYIPIVEV